MPMPRYGQRYWANRTPYVRRPSWAAFRGRETADVVVIGGGFTGCVAAHVLAGAGVDVVLLEAGRIADGSTAGGLGVILPEADATFRDVEAASGRGVARPAWKEAHRASRELATALRKLSLGRERSESALVVNARSHEDAALLRREQSARKAAGVSTAWWPARTVGPELGTATAGALKAGAAVLIDPVRTTLALARAATASGASLFERSAVRRTTFTRRYATVFTAAGSIRTTCVFVATGEPGTLFGQLRRHVRRADGYVVVTEPLTAEMRRQTGRRRLVVTEPGADRRWLRWLSDGRALFAGALAKPVPARRRDKAVIQRTGQLMYELSVRYPVISGLPPAWGWDVPVTSTPDGVPWIGPHRNYPFHFFALAFGWHGESLAWLAARAALRQVRGETRREDEAFGFGRYL